MKGQEPAFPRTRVGGVQNDWGASGMTTREVMELVIIHGLVGGPANLGTFKEIALQARSLTDALLDPDMDSDTE